MQDLSHLKLKKNISLVKVEEDLREALKAGLK